MNPFAMEHLMLRLRSVLRTLRVAVARQVHRAERLALAESDQGFVTATQVVRISARQSVLSSSTCTFTTS